MARIATVSFSKFRSKEEEFFNLLSRNLPQFVPALSGYRVGRVTYEGKTFHMGAVKYTPDFNLVLWNTDMELDDTKLVNVEVKGSKKQRGYDQTRAKLKIAAGMYPEYTWIEVVVDAREKVFDSFEIIAVGSIDTGS